MLPCSFLPNMSPLRPLRLQESAGIIQDDGADSRQRQISQQVRASPQAVVQQMLIRPVYEEYARRVREKKVEGIPANPSH